MKTISGNAKQIDGLKAFEGTLVATQNAMCAYFEKVNEDMLDRGLINPFVEKWKRGRPTLEQLIRKDFAKHWREDLDPHKRIGFLAAIMNTPAVPGAKGTLKFIQRGHEAPH